VRGTSDRRWHWRRAAWFRSCSSFPCRADDLLDLGLKLWPGPHPAGRRGQTQIALQSNASPHR
jgi:hypothetical protein